jgi:uroporphyrinogen decarboxylase
MLDDMRPRERKKAFREGKDMDRLPTWAFPQDYLKRLVGTTLKEYHMNPRKQIEATLKAYERWELDVVEMGFNIGLDLGVERGFPSDEDYAVVTKTIDPTEKEIESWGIEDPKSNPKARGSWDMLDELQDKLGVQDKAEIALMIPMPFSMAAMSIGIEKFLKKLIRDPDYIHLLVGKIAELIAEAVPALKGYDFLVWTGDPIASGSMLKLEQYRTFALPYQKRVIDALKKVVLHEDQIMLHMCGNTTKLWEAMADTGVKLINIDDTIDFADASRRVGDRLHVVGNIAPMTMLLGTPEDIENDVKASVKNGMRGKLLPIPGFGDAPPIASPLENFDTLYAALRKHAKYPPETNQ